MGIERVRLVSPGGARENRDNVESTPWFLRGGGAAGETARSVDWAKTPLGAPAGWPVTLKTTLATMFRARQPMFLWWGEALIQFYNDAYLPSFGKGKHPRAMGQRGRECWQEIWPIIGPQIEDVMERGIGSWNEDGLVPIFRNEKIEEVYWTYTYSPVFGESGAVAGTLVICTETTKRVLGERRANVLHALVGETSVAVDRASLAAASFAVLGRAAADIPLAALYDRDPGAGALAASASIGLSARAADALGRRLAGELAETPGRARLVAIGDLAGDREPPSSSEDVVREAYVVPLSPDVADSRSYLVCGISPRLSFDDSYRRFLEQVSGHLQLASTRLDEAARRATIEIERRNLLEQVPLATAVVVGPDHVFELANPVFRQMVGRQDLLGKAYREVFPEAHGTLMPSVIERAYATGEPLTISECPVPIDRGTGVVEDAFFKFTLQPLRDAHGRVYAIMAIGIEVTEQVSARQVLERAQVEREDLLRENEAASRAKDEFLAMLGHELRNPLSPIMTALQLMRRKADGHATREQEVIERQVNHLIRLVDDLLDVAKIARGKVDLRRELVDMADVVSKAVEIASDVLEQRHQRLSIACERGRFLCNADPVRLSQVIANLLTNAAKYTHPGGNIALRVSATKGEVAVSVKDNGVGISSEMLPRVFNLFEQAHRSSDRAEGGLGIGLSLVKNLVSLHGGSVTAESEGPGRGSEFTVRLPLADDAAAAAGEDAPPAPATPKAASARRVLVVDDNVDAAEVLGDLLESMGHEVETAFNPIAALDVAARFLPEVAVLDIGLPVIDGYELATRLHALPGLSRCRLIALTGYGQEHDRRRSRAAGFSEHLVKPVDFDRLVALVETLTGSPSPPPA